MKTYSKTKITSYTNVLIQDEGGLDTIQIKKQSLLLLFASHLRQISTDATPVKVLA